MKVEIDFEQVDFDRAKNSSFGQQFLIAKNKLQAHFPMCGISGNAAKSYPIGSLLYFTKAHPAHKSKCTTLTSQLSIFSVTDRAGTVKNYFCWSDISTPNYHVMETKNFKRWFKVPRCLK